MAARFYCPDSPREGRQRLSADEAHHLSRVCRLGTGDIVEVFDGKGLATRSQVVAIVHGAVELEILAVEPERDPPLRLTLATAVPKGERFDWLVEKATELGVERLIPIMTARSVVRPGKAKLDRLRRSIIEASKQSRRDRLMLLEPLMDWARVVERDESSIAIPSRSRWPCRACVARDRTRPGRHSGRWTRGRFRTGGACPGN